MSEYRDTYAQRMRDMMESFPGGAVGFLELARKPGYAAGMGIAAMAEAPQEALHQHMDELATLAGTPGHEAEGDNDEAAGALFLENLRAALCAGNALHLDPAVMQRLEARAQDRGTTLLGLLGSMFNTFRLVQKGITRL
jgi:hypothetical protein